MIRLANHRVVFVCLVFVFALSVGACSTDDAVDPGYVSDNDNEGEGDVGALTDVGDDDDDEDDDHEDSDDVGVPDDTGGDDEQDVGGDDDVGEPEDTGGDDEDVTVPQEDTGNGDSDGCDNNEDCDGEEICVRPEPGAEGSCQSLDDVSLDGDSCSDSEECASGLCYDQQCTQECDGAGECLEDWTCEDKGDGEVCVPPSCTSDGDCASGQVCAFSPGGADDALGTVCLPDNGGHPPGVFCEDDDACAARYCHDGDEICSAPCIGDNEPCSDVQMCEENTVSIGGESGAFDVCKEYELIECNSPDDCTADDLTCNRLPGAVDGAACGLTNPGGAGLGESCTSPAQCESDVCWESGDETTGECTVFCSDSAADCASEQVCTRLSEEVGACLESCVGNADCDNGNACQLGIDHDDSMHGYCNAYIGDLDTGDECSAPDDCKNGLCLTVTTYAVTPDSCDFDSHCDDGFECTCPPGDPNCTDEVCVSEEGTTEQRCSEMCETNSDCDTGEHVMTECMHNIVVTWESGISDNISGCSLPPED